MTMVASIVAVRLMEDAKETAYDLRNESPRVAELIERLRQRVLDLEELMPNRQKLEDAEDVAREIEQEAEVEAERIIFDAEDERDEMLDAAREEAKRIVDEARAFSCTTEETK